MSIFSTFLRAEELFFHSHCYNFSCYKVYHSLSFFPQTKHPTPQTQENRLNIFIISLILYFFFLRSSCCLCFFLLIFLYWCCFNIDINGYGNPHFRCSFFIFPDNPPTSFNHLLIVVSINRFISIFVWATPVSKLVNPPSCM